ncbi:unnamed protein product [Polarella glacialis]|uniref:Peridinin chlorophyll-a binding protein apoprotein n=1 Tax=Polarella glacialis TaxID=89957 RepID=A0A813IRG4_POLGL|nr:unnamed protein product [Polarella glacialis]
MAKLLPCVVAMVAVLALCNWLPAFVPPPAGQSLRHGVHMSTAVGAAAVLGAAPAAFADKIDDAATKLSEASYPFLKEIDWTSNVYGSLPNANPVKVLAVINKALVMGASMDSAALKKGVLAHASAIGHVDSKGMIPLPDYHSHQRSHRPHGCLCAEKPGHRRLQRSWRCRQEGGSWCLHEVAREFR